MNAQVTTNFRSTSSASSVTVILFDYDSPPCCQTVKLYEILNEDLCNILCYTDIDACVDYIKSLSKGKKVFFTVTPAVCPAEILPSIHQLRQIDSIFLWAVNEQHDHLLEQYYKIIGVYHDLDDLIENIKENILLVEQQQQSIYYFRSNQKSVRDLTNESGFFIWFILIIDTVIKMPRDDDAKSDTVRKCLEYYRKNKNQLKKIEQWSETYCSNDIIKWYTKQSFIYKLINKVLRTDDVEQLHTFRFLIAELHLKITQEYEKLKSENQYTVVLYRGSKLSHSELEKMKDNTNNFISMNGFVSTSRSKDVALIFAGTSNETDIKQSVLFEIECEIKPVAGVEKSVIFADIASFSDYPDEEEVLFTLGSTFRIISVSHCQARNIHVVKMQPSTEGIKLAKEYVDLDNKYFEEMSVEIRFGRLLTDMGQYEKAMKYFEKILTNPHTLDLPSVYFHIGRVYYLSGEYVDSLRNYLISGKIIEEEQQKTSSQLMHLARVFNNIGSVFYKKKDYDQALYYHKKSYNLRETILGVCHRDTAQSLHNIGNVFFGKGEYNVALHYYEKSFKVREQLLPIDHTEKAASLNNIALVYWKQRRLDQALEFHLKSLNMFQNVLPEEHDDIASLLTSVGNLCIEQSKFDDAFYYLMKSLNMRKNLFPNGHPNLALTLHCLGCFFEIRHQYVESVEYYTKELNAYKAFLPVGHSALMRVEENIARLKLLI